MLLPRVAVAALAVRQAIDIFPSSYCQPECPSCKANIADFDSATSCVPASAFITNCGSCQQCVIAISFQNSNLTDLPTIEAALQTELNRCENTTVSSDISALQSQASRLQDLGNSLASITMTSNSKTTQFAITPTPTGPAAVAVTSSGTLTYILTDSPVAATDAAAPSGTDSSSSAETSPATGPGPPLNSEWIAGPVIGSVLGMATVFIVIYCTRRKRRKEEWELGPVQPKEILDDESQDPEAGKAQLHSECVVPREMENTEIIPPVELPALEPVGMELLTPRDDAPEKEWPLPISPLPRLFAEIEMRDERTGADSPKHDTFYHP